MRRLSKPLWKKIFEKLDPRTFVGLRMLSKEFCEGVNNHLNELEVWRSLCYDEITFDCRTMIMARRYPYNLVKHQSTVDDQDLWRGTYFAFKKWTKITESPQNNRSMLSVSHLPTRITCIATFDKYLLVSFENSEINCYDYSAADMNEPVYSVRHSHQIEQCEFWYSKNNSQKRPSVLLIVARDNENQLVFWDIKKKQRLFAPDCSAHRICVGEGRHFCIAEYDGVLTSYERNSSDRIEPGASVRLDLRRDEHIINLVIDGKYITAISIAELKGTRVGTILYLFEAVIKNNAVSVLEMEQEKDIIMLPQKLSRLNRIVMPTLNFFFGLADSMIGSTNYYENEWHQYDLVDKLGSPVTAVAFHAQILMLGLENGEIHFLRIENYVGIMELEKEIERSAGRKITNKPIIDITIMEYEENPSIVVASEDEVILISFEDFL